MRQPLHGSIRVSMIVALALVAVFLRPAPHAEAAAFTVNTTDDVDDGTCEGTHCSLREAINAANANGATADTITFSVTGTISPATALPDLSAGNTTIAGANQQVTIDGSGLPGGTACLNLGSNGNVVEGLVIRNCATYGIRLGGGGNRIGGTTASARNVIRDSNIGVGGTGPQVTGNQILGNYIGVNQAGDAAAPNVCGIILFYGATGNTVGGAVPGARNVISGNSPYCAGVKLQGAGPDNVVQGNYIGLDSSGSFAIPNGAGVALDDGPTQNSVLDNVISGNRGPGVFVGALWYVLSGQQGYYAPIELVGHIDVSAGQMSWGQDAVNGQVAVWPMDSNKGGTLTIRLRQVGATCYHGPIWLRHGGTGETVQITGPFSGTCPGNGKVFFTWSGSFDIPLAPYGPAADNVIQGNHVGTDPAGEYAIPNAAGVGVVGSSRETVVGGPNEGDRNVISGNQMAGVFIDGRSENDIIQGNSIGVDESGTIALPNGGVDGGVGVVLGLGFDNTGAVGTVVERNVISGNYGPGLVLAFDVAGVSVTGNSIGTDSSGGVALPNYGDGIALYPQAQDNAIGGTAVGEANAIAHNFGAGVLVYGATTIRNTIRGNSIHSNWGLGIDNVDGGNTELTPPTITGISPAVCGVACADCMVDLYSDEDGEGATWEGSVQAGPTGDFCFPPSITPTGPYVTTTATDGDGNTSEFSGGDGDGDGCADIEETAPNSPPKPGQDPPGYDPLAWWDFFDVPVPAYPDMTPNGPKDKAVAMDDVLAVLFYVGTFAGDGGSPNPNGVAWDSVKGSCDFDADTVPDPEGFCYDRSPSSALNPPWDAGPPDGAVAMDDVLAVLAQVGLDCSGPPPWEV